MDADEQRIFYEIMKQSGLDRSLGFETDTSLESLAVVKDTFLMVFESKLDEIVSLGGEGNFGGHDAVVDLLTFLMKTDARLPQLGAGTELCATGKGSLMFPDKGQVLFFSDNSQVHGEYQGYAVSEYWEHLDIPLSDEDYDYPIEKRFLHPFGLHLLITNPRLINEHGDTIPTDEQFALLPLNYPKLQLFKRVSV